MAIAKCIQVKYRGMPKHLRHNLKVGKTYLVEDIFISISGNRQAKIKLFGKKCLYTKAIFVITHNDGTPFDIFDEDSQIKFRQEQHIFDTKSVIDKRMSFTELEKQFKSEETE